MELITQRMASNFRPISTASNLIGRSSSTGVTLIRNTSNDRLSNNTVQPIRIIKTTSSSPSSAGSSSEDLTAAGTSNSSSSTSSVIPADLSPPVITNMNDFKTFLSFYNPQSINNNVNNNSNNNNINDNNHNIDNVNDTNSINKNSNNNSTKSILNQQNDLLKQNSLIKLRDFILFEQQSSVDSLNSAFNTISREYFYWKKFDKKDYMKKLEAYFIMQEYNSIYKYKELLFDENYAYAIFEPHHGDLHWYMKEKKKLDETEAKFIFKQCVEAVNDCHINGIIVRDIKLKKFVFINQERTKVVLANLEDCLVLDEDAPNDLIKSQQGCPAYVSPEVLNPHPNVSYSGRLSDSWSLGIILFTLLLGRYPFHHPTITVMFAKIARGRFQIPQSSGLSMDAKILLRSLIRFRPDERLLPFEILKHNWLKQIDYQQLKHQLNNNENFLKNLNTLNFQKQQLGISLSAPNRILNTNSSFNSNEPNSKRIKLTSNENQDDCVVPN